MIDIKQLEEETYIQLKDWQTSELEKYIDHLTRCIERMVARLTAARKILKERNVKS